MTNPVDKTFCQDTMVTKDLDSDGSVDTAGFFPSADGNNVDLKIYWGNSGTLESVYSGPALVNGACSGYRMSEGLGAPQFYLPSGGKLTLTDYTKPQTERAEKALQASVDKIVKEAFENALRSGLTVSSCQVKVTYQPNYGTAPDTPNYGYKVEFLDASGAPIEVHPAVSGKIPAGVLTLVPPFVLFANRYEITANVEVEVAGGIVTVESSMVKTVDSTAPRKRE